MIASMGETKDFAQMAEEAEAIATTSQNAWIRIAYTRLAKEYRSILCERQVPPPQFPDSPEAPPVGERRKKVRDPGS